MSATFADRAFDLQQQGHDPDDIATQLVKEGASPGLARICVRDLDWQTDDSASTSDDSGTALLWLVGGVLVTVVTFAAAAGGGKFVIAVGPIAYGLSRLLRR